MIETDLTEYKKRMDEVNKYLEGHGINPITNPEYFKPNNTKLINEMRCWSDAGHYSAAATALRIIGRKDDEIRLTQTADP